jgi:hypothetical protein
MEMRCLCSFHVAFSLTTETKLHRLCGAIAIKKLQTTVVGFGLSIDTKSFPCKRRSRLEEGRLDATLEGNDGFERTNEEKGRKLSRLTFLKSAGAKRGRAALYLKAPSMASTMPMLLEKRILYEP